MVFLRGSCLVVEERQEFPVRYASKMIPLKILNEFCIELRADRDYGGTEITIIATLHQISTHTNNINAYANSVANA